jgi:hypothetical protein
MRGRDKIKFAVCLTGLLMMSTGLRADENIHIDAVRVPLVDHADAAPTGFAAVADNLVHRLQSTAIRYALIAERFTDVERRYHAITGRMQFLLARERGLMMDSTTPASVARVQLASAVGDGDAVSSEIRTQVKGFEAVFADATAPIAREYSQALAHCRTLDLQTMDSAALAEEKASCVRLADAAKAYNPLIDRVNEGLAHLDRVYADEHRAQESLIAEATLIQ